MIKRLYLPVLAVALLAGLGAAVLTAGARAGPTAQVDGTVNDAQGPVAGARVRVRGTENLTYTQSDGAFSLSGLAEGQEIELTAWSEGYYIASTHVTPPTGPVTLTLRRYHTSDNPDYEWVSPVAGTSETACGNCHPMIMPQWENNAHGMAISNDRFFSLYNGTNLSGTISIGPGYLNDFPGTAGVCASCHAPGAGVDGYLSTDMNAVRDGLTNGIHCDFCHKIGGAYLDPASGSLYPNAPGVVSLRVLRPPEGDQIFFGPYDDIHDPDTYLPLISDSQYCAACHQFSFWGTPIYESYEEWLASDYAAMGVTCQDCHMPPNGDTFFALPEVGGLERPPESIPSHLDLGAASIELLQNTVTMEVSAERALDRVDVTVTITNTGAGHHVPTDFPGRHMILVVTATRDGGYPLAQSAGSAVPAWGGDQAGLPGTAFAKVLRDSETGEQPVVSYWKQTLITSDNRIPAFATSASEYTFDLPDLAGDVQVSAQLLFRRVFQSVADQKDWDMPDVLMEEQTVLLSAGDSYKQYIPWVSTLSSGN